MSHDAFLRAIRAEPDDDTHRLVYADWLTEQGDVRGEFIRVQCELATMSADDPRRALLLAREKELLDAHRLDWIDLAFADWLGHPKKVCRNPEGHNFCKLVAQGIRTRCERDRLSADDPKRKKLDQKFKRLGESMEDDFNYLADTRDVIFFEDAEFRRGFVEWVMVQDYAVVLFADALADLEVVRELEIENDATVDLFDKDYHRLIPVLDRLSLNELDSHSPINSIETVCRLAMTPGLRSLTSLKLWFEFAPTGDAAVQILAESPHLSGLRSLTLEHTRTFTDLAIRAILDSPILAGLTHCWLRNSDEEMTISEPLARRFRERFGQDLNAG